ncbi:MAG: hypothetical protein ACR2HP_15040 [Ilumatobacteraceae bacterium]
MDFDIPAELHEILAVTRSFARTDLREAERELDAIAYPAEACTSERYRTVRSHCRSPTAPPTSSACRAPHSSPG